MQLTRTGEYAVRTMIHLSALPFGTVVQISDIAREWSIPDTFLRKITGQLADAELIATQRGSSGGIRLAQSPEKLTVLDVIEAVEGKIFLNKCLICGNVCPRDEWCQVHVLWSEAQRKLKEILTSRTLAHLAAESLERKARLCVSQHQVSAA